MCLTSLETCLFLLIPIGCGKWLWETDCWHIYVDLFRILNWYIDLPIGNFAKCIQDFLQVWLEEKQMMFFYYDTSFSLDIFISSYPTRRRQWHPTPVLLPGKPHGWRSLVGLHGVAKSQTRLSDFTFMHWRRKWQATPVCLPGESQGWGSLVDCCLWGRTESDTTEVT